MKKNIILLLIWFSVSGCEKIFNPILLNEPDIIFISINNGERNIYGVDFDGSNFINLTYDDSLEIMSMSISPDGEYIIYEGNNKLFIMNINGTGKEYLAESKSIVEPTYSNSGDFIIFGDSRVNGHTIITDLLKYDLQTEEITNLTKGNLSYSYIYNWYPSISSDDLNVVYQVTLTDTNLTEYNSELFIMDSDGHNHRRLTFSDPDFSPFCPKFAKNSELVVFRIRSNLYKINFDGSNMVQIFKNLEYACREFKIYPDGNHIIFAGTLREVNPEYTGIFLYNISTGGVKEIITATGPPSFAQFDVSKHGEIIFYKYNQGLYRINLDGTNFKKILQIYGLVKDICIRPY